MTTAAPTLTLQDFEELYERCKHWGRWGADDQRGALNFITPEVRAAAAALVREGATVSCSLPLPVDPAPDNPRPVMHLMLRAGDLVTEADPQGGSMDYFAIAPHGIATSHLDALCHVFWRGQMYNGFPASDVTSAGSRSLAIDVAREGIVSRGVLLDIPRLRGVPFLKPGEAIHARELEQAEAAQGVRVQSGDILIIHTGRQAWHASVPPSDYLAGFAGLHPDAGPWLHDREVAVLGCDGISDVTPSPVEGVRLPFHVLPIVAMGLHLLDNLATEQLAAACAARDRWAFQFIVAPLVLLRGTGSPVNPIAVF